MQLLKISKDTTLLELTRLVGQRNVSNILHANSLPRVPNIGEAFNALVNRTVNNTPVVEPQRKATLLNSLVSDSDIFEAAALLSEPGWQVLSAQSTLPEMLFVPESINLPDSVNILGNGQPVKTEVYDQATRMLLDSSSVPPNTIDPAIFSEYSARRDTKLIAGTVKSDPMQWFPIPWGMITVYSSLDQTSRDIPVYPEEVSDNVVANYDNMPDLLFQYEKWSIYKSSENPPNSYVFDMHRDMWSGDHRDGRCSDLINFCKANVYASYQGSRVLTSTFTLFVSGEPLASGILKDVKVEWDGPIGLDGWYLHVKMTLTIENVASAPLSFESKKRAGLIG